jgi:hypothetical protein
MSSHPINLFVRFLLEMTAIVVIGIWGWKFGTEVFRIVLAVGLPTLTAAIWGIFAVPNDPSRSGKAPVPVNGSIRLLIELAIFVLTIWALYELDFVMLSWLFGSVVILHYAVSFNRILWLMKH